MLFSTYMCYFLEVENKTKYIYLANSFRLKVTFLHYVTYIVTRIPKNYRQKSMTVENIQNTKDL